MARLSSLTKDLVGRRYPRYNFLVTRSWVEDYRNALGYNNNAGEFNVPRTFISCLRDSEFCGFAQLGLHLSQLLHAAQHYHFHASIHINDWISSQTQIVRCAKKSGKNGEMVFLEFSNEFRKTTPDDSPNGDWKLGDLVAESVTKIIVKDEA